MMIVIGFIFLGHAGFKTYAKPGSLETDAALAIWRERIIGFTGRWKSAILQNGWTRDRDSNRTDCYRYCAELARRLKQKNLNPDAEIMARQFSHFL